MQIPGKKQTIEYISILFAFALVMLSVTSVSAQGVAEIWLSKATEKLQNKGTEIVFRINEEGVHISGKLLMEGERFSYDTEDMKIWYDGTTQWTMQMGNGYNELYINNPTPQEQQTINPYLLLTEYKDYFTATDGGEKTYNGKLVHMITMKANDESQEPSHINVYIASDASLSALEFMAPDGQLYKIEVRSMRNGLTFPKDTFTYRSEAYPADEVIDMR